MKKSISLISASVATFALCGSAFAASATGTVVEVESNPTGGVYATLSSGSNVYVTDPTYYESNGERIFDAVKNMMMHGFTSQAEVTIFYDDCYFGFCIATRVEMEY